MKNYIESGEVMNYTNGTGSAIASGAVVPVGELVGIAAADIADGETGSVSLTGVFLVAKAAGVWTQGQKLFWDKTNKNFVGTASSDADVAAGIAFLAAVNGATTGYVKLSQMPKVVAAEAAVATADGSDAASTQALANALKVSLNSLLTKLKASGVMDN